MGEWVEKSLGDICVIRTGNKDVNQGSENGKYPFFTCAQRIYKIDDYVFDGEAILIAGNGFFNVKYYNGKFDAYQRTYVLMSFQEYGKYIFHYIQHRLDDITSDNRGSTIRYIRIGDLTNYKIPLPPTFDEQRRIVTRIEQLLSKINAANERLNKIPALLKRYRQSVLSAACSGRLTADWHERKESGPWEEKRFSEVAQVDSNLVKPNDYLKYPHIAPDNIERETGKLLSYNTIEEDRVISNKHLFRSGHIIYSKIRPYLNKVVLVDFEGLCSADMYPISTTLNPFFLKYYMLSNRFVVMASGGERTILPKINKKELSVIPVPVPPLSEQEEIVRRVDKLFGLADRVEARYNAVKKQLARAEKAVYAKAFRGEL